MSYRAYFLFSQGLAKPLFVPKGTKVEICKHVKHVEDTLKIKREKYKDNPEHWEFHPDLSHLTDKQLCEIAEKHNEWVRRLYDKLGEWSQEPVKSGEKITPKDAEKFWPALQTIEVEPSRWTGEYYTERMRCLYEVMRGNETEGVSFDAKKLTPKQAAGVINLFSPYLDKHDRRLDVPKGEDYLASSYDGGYEWCSKCGAVTYEHMQACRRKKCPAKEDCGYEEEEEDEQVE